MTATATSATRQIARAASLVIVLFFFSRVTGLAREMIIGARFGTTAEYDAYLAAFRVPDMIFYLVAGGALGSAFIPVFTGCLTRRQLTGAWRLFSAVSNLVVIIMTAVAAVAALLAPWLVRTVLAPGFAPWQQALTAELMRWMLIGTVIFGVSGIIMGVLNSFQHFLLPALAPILYNLSIIFAAWFLAPMYGVYGLAIGVIVGAGLHLDIQLFGLWRYKARYYRTLGLRNPNVREVGRLMAPRVLGLAVVQINFWINTLLASTLVSGSLSALNYAWLLMLLPQGIIAQGVATAAFPTFAALEARGQRNELRRVFGSTLRGVLFLAIPAAVGLLVWRVPLIRLLLERGEFTTRSTALTAAALAFYSIGLIGHSAIEILARGYYALHDTRTPVVVGIASDGAQYPAQPLAARAVSIGGPGARQHDCDDAGDDRVGAPAFPAAGRTGMAATHRDDAEIRRGRAAHGRPIVVGSQQLEQCADLAAGACRADRRRTCLSGGSSASADARIADRATAHSGPPIGRQFVRLRRHRGVWVGQASDTVDSCFISCLNHCIVRRLAAKIGFGRVSRSLPHEAPGTSPGFLISAHADPRGCDNLPLSHLFSSCYEKLRIVGQIDAVQRQGDAQRLAKLAGPVGQVPVCDAGSLSAHGLDAFSGEDASDEHRAGMAVARRHRVQTVVHAVDEVNVSDARRPEHDRTARRAAVGMGGGVVCPAVGFRLTDQPAQALAVQQRAPAAAPAKRGRQPRCRVHRRRAGAGDWQAGSSCVQLQPPCFTRAAAQPPRLSPGFPTARPGHRSVHRPGWPAAAAPVPLPGDSTSAWFPHDP